MDATPDTASKQDAESQHRQEATESIGEDIIQQRISDIQMQLDETYNIFVNARETLSSISFEHLGASLNAETIPSDVGTRAAGVDAANQQDFALVRDETNRIDLGKSLEKLENLPLDSRLECNVEQIPELNKFFKVLADLREGISKINGHQKSITELNHDINTLSEPAEAEASDSGATLTSQMSNMSMN
ncbi:uncharacterized protein LOC118461921 [Anopheles albimanus]|uniref:Uncharacterized protein n=1 Tax=Anopheles albimanus TaxID=7167 RepID=A0A182F734_ANOAL|nr:uncharacterized protein LOC118461921 [Anopheles albimanus]